MSCVTLCMAERKAQNKYYPPDWDPSKGSLNKFHKSHPLRDRARKLGQGIMIIRFEMPFNIWCGHCEKHIGMGVRYNAEKKRIGEYYTTPIWQFRMKCHLCSGWMEIHTDPQNADYKIVSGARRKMETWDAVDSETISLQDKEEKEKLLTNPFYKIEHDLNDVKKAAEDVPVISQIQALNDKYWNDSFRLSQIVRNKFRTEKKEWLAEEQVALELASKNSLDLRIMPEIEMDGILAKSISFESAIKPIENIEMKKKIVESSSIFQTQQTPIQNAVLGKLRNQAKQNYHSKTELPPLQLVKKRASANDNLTPRSCDKKLLVAYTSSDTD